MMKNFTPILSISGSDGTGCSGIQSDVKTISDLMGYALTAITCLTIEPEGKCKRIEDIQQESIIKQVRHIISSCHPKALKIGLVRDAETIKALRNEIIACRQIVCAPGIYDSDGFQLVKDEAIDAIKKYLIPESTLLMLRCNDAEKILGFPINSDEDMIKGAQTLVDMGAKWILLRGGHQTKGRLTALLYGENEKSFFTSYNTQGWQRHGVSGALSSAITTRLGMGDSVPTAVKNAHKYIHSQVVYSVSTEERNLRSADLYDQFMALVADHYHSAHDVNFYADKLNISTRYLSYVTNSMIDKTPKQVISDYLIEEAKKILEGSRLTVQQVSYKLGFTSQAMFCKFFKRQEQCSPSKYRNKYNL